MSSPITFNAPIRDTRAELQSRLIDAPAQHAEALLAGYEVLQGLHDAGVLEIMRGALGSRDRVLNIAVRAAEGPDSIRAIRNLLILSSMVSEIEPESLKSFAQVLPQALQLMVHRPERPGLWRLLKDFFWNRDFRHGLAAVNTMLEVLGKSLSGANRADENSAASKG